MASFTEQSTPTPVMVVSRSAHRLALRLARRGKTVIYRCKTAYEIESSHEDAVAVLDRSYFFSRIFLDAWTVNDAGISHISGGTIMFLLYSTDMIVFPVELEVHV